MEVKLAKLEQRVDDIHSVMAEVKQDIKQVLERTSICPIHDMHIESLRVTKRKHDEEIRDLQRWQANVMGKVSIMAVIASLLTAVLLSLIQHYLP